jgi:hypothetical protein
VVQLNGGGHKAHKVIIITADRSVTVVIARRLHRFGYNLDEGKQINKVLEGNFFSVSVTCKTGSVMEG